jgi:hypothetical protein
VKEKMRVKEKRKKAEGGGTFVDRHTGAPSHKRGLSVYRPEVTETFGRFFLLLISSKRGF